MLNDVIKGSAPHLQAKLLCPGQTDRFPPTVEEEVLTDAKVKHSRLAFYLSRVASIIALLCKSLTFKLALDKR